MTTVKLCKVTDKDYTAIYQTAPLHLTGIGRFQVYKTDNANARAIGRRPRWTVYDLYDDARTGRAELDTLAEVREWIARRINRNSN